MNIGCLWLSGSGPLGSGSPALGSWVWPWLWALVVALWVGHVHTCTWCHKWEESRGVLGATCPPGVASAS